MNNYTHLSFLKTFTAIVLAIIGLNNTAATTVINVNQCTAFADSTTHMLLVSVPQSWFGSTVTASISSIDAQVLTIDGMELGEDNTFTFTDITGNKSWQVTCLDNNEETILYTLQFTFLPIVHLAGDFGNNYTSGTMVLAEPGKPASEVMTAQVKWRGQSTNTPDKHKRNYSIKFVNANGESQNRKLLDMRRDNHWILDAGQADMARVRNRVATELWLDMAHEPHYYDQAPDALSGVRGKMVEVFLGNEYRGIYALTEAMDRKQLQLVKHDTINNIFHGGLWKTNLFNVESGFRWAHDFNNTRPDYYGFETKYPELDEVFPTSYEVLYDAINAIALTEDYVTYNNVVDNHIDIPVAIDYTIFYLTLNALDNSAKNIYWLCYDRAVDSRLSIAVWDLDATAGGSWTPNEWRPPNVAYNSFRRPYNWVFLMFFHNRCKYRQQFLDRYDQLRSTWLSVESLVNRYSTAIDRLIACGAATREQNRWNGDSDLYGHPLDFEDEKQYITEWFTNRMPLLDVWIHHHLCDVNNDGAVNAADISTIYDYIMTGSSIHSGTLDTNFDGIINAADITSIYDVLLNGD